MPDKTGGARTKARKRALDILFEADLRGVDVVECLELHCTEADPPVRTFTAEIVEGVDKHWTKLDAAIATHLPSDWTIDRMPTVDRNLARIAVYEMLFTNTAQQIVIAEAVGLAKSLSTDESPTFLNGVLSAIARDPGM